MKKISVYIKRGLLLLIIAILITPWLQSEFGFIKSAPLHGTVTKPENETFSFSSWFSGSFQKRKEEFLNDTFGFRNFCVRINNQIAFSLFHKANANGVIVGKNNYLYEKNYIDAYNGTDFVGYDSIEHIVRKLKFIQDTLGKLDKNLIVIFAAGKGSFYPEYFPDKYRIKRGMTNYEVYSELARKYRIANIDFNKYFLENKYTSQYPLYPQYGIHWSHYGMFLAADSITRYIEKARKIDMPHIYWDGIDMAQPRDVDYDIAEGMNIWERLKSYDMAYPRVRFQADSGKVKPAVLVISDSYYWDMYNLGISSTFSNNHFWYYNKHIYPEENSSVQNPAQVSFKEVVSGHDVFILMATEANLSDFGWGFIQRAYDYFKGVKSN